MNEDISQSLQTAIDNLVKSTQQTATVISQQAVQNIKTVQTSLNTSLPDQAKNLDETTEDFPQTLEVYGTKIIRFATIMVELGWPPHEELYLSDIYDIVAAYDEHGGEVIKPWVDTLLVGRFGTRRLNNLLKNWTRKEWLTKRVPILKQAIKAHTGGNYFVSISAILPQIEGILAEGFNHEGRMNGFHQKGYFDQLLVDKETVSFDQAIKSFVFSIVLAGFEHGKTPKSFLSRHAILHGADTSYGTKPNSLKCILLFDYLQEKFQL